MSDWSDHFRAIIISNVNVDTFQSCGDVRFIMLASDLPAVSTKLEVL